MHEIVPFTLELTDCFADVRGAPFISTLVLSEMEDPHANEIPSVSPVRFDAIQM